ncbi:MAG: hypothetical protein OEZ48_02655 [Candidatus Bathyarchaeota archaeon]|nr:hypothetical protein [Candidatus Bathyarchaeota archaeon]MDH5686753.1 hypothetical protein [Candidatus Bathyarchaeota archaeon]
MAYDRRKIVVYGGAAVITATIMIVALLSAPFEEEVGFVPIVELESVTPGTIKITIITNTQDINVTELKLTIDRFEVRPKDGNWTEVEIQGGRLSFDLLRRQGTFIDAVISQLEPETVIRMHTVQGFEYANATLNNGVVVGVELPSEIEVKTPVTMSLRVYVIKM